MPRLEIHLLGAPEIRAGGALVEVPRRRVRALLYYLAAQDTPCARGAPLAILWGDAPDREASRALSDALYRLRRALGEASVVATADGRLRLAACDVDLVAFDSALAAGDLETAVALWRGPFLDGFGVAECQGFEDWLARERRRLAERYHDALARLADRRAQAGDPEAALAAAERLFRADPLREDAVQRLMRLHAALGQRSAALRAYEAGREALARDLGVAPGRETEAIRERILKADAAAVSRGPRPAATDVLTVDRSFPHVGRAAALAALSDALAVAGEGRGGTLIVTGEPGIGKSRLLAELAAASGRARVLAACCHESSRDLAFQPVIEALRAGTSPEELAGLELPAPFWHALRRLVPELPEATEAEAPAAPVGLPGWERSRLLEALTRVVAGLAELRPLLLVIDDLQWADDSTLLFVAYLARRVSGRRVLVVGTARLDEVEGTLRMVRDELARLGLARELSLERLSAGETIAMVGRLAADAEAADRLGRFLHQESAGNPLFIVELLRAGVTSPQAPLPGSLRALIAARLDRLDREARDALAAAAALGYDLDAALIRRTTGAPEEETVRAIERLCAAGVLVERADGGLAFGHDKFREVAWDGLTFARRALLHRRAAEALEGRPGAEPGRIAYHAARGGDDLRAFDWALRAAERALSAHANREAFAHYTTAVEAAERLGEAVGPGRVAEVVEARGRVALGMSDYRAAIADFERACREPGRLSARRHLALACFWAHEPTARALSHAEAALAEARASDDRREVAASSAVLAAILVTRGRLREGIARGEEALRVGRETGDEYLVADAVGTLGLAHGWRGRIARARAEVAESLDVARRRRWGLLVPRALFFSAIHAGVAGDYEAALAHLAECRRRAEASDDRVWLARIPNTVGWVHQEMGDLEASLRHDLEGVQAARRSPWPEPLGNALVNLGLDYVRRGDPQAGLSALEEASALLGRDETMQWRWETRLLIALGEAWLARGDAARAAGFVDRALALARRTRAAKHAARARLLDAVVAARLGRASEARASARRGARLAAHLGAPRLVFEAESVLAALAARAGRAAEADRHARLAADLGARFPGPPPSCVLLG